MTDNIARLTTTILYHVVRFFATFNEFIYCCKTKFSKIVQIYFHAK